ncbi:MAG: toprim domain-containing protein [Armatimonadota bacterium]|nr:toprim domain-containing protein [Armatimonadota bacterium]
MHSPAVSSWHTQSAPKNSQQNWRRHLHEIVPLTGTPGEAYLTSRSISCDIAHQAGARYTSNWFGRPAVVFPIRDLCGQLVAAQGRYLEDSDKDGVAIHLCRILPQRIQLKTRTAGPKKLGVFATPGAVEADVLVIVEAPIDALSLHLCGIPAIALCGKDGWPDWLRVVFGLCPVLIAFDADQAGEAAARKLSQEFASLSARVGRLRPEGAKDWNELLQKYRVETLQTALTQEVCSIVEELTQRME